MGTRADFYVGRGSAAEWLGSIAWDGYPTGNPAPTLSATTADDFRARVAMLLSAREDGTTPDMGWPWPWRDSGTTDYAYAFDGNRVFGSCFGGPWFDATKPQPEEEGDFDTKVAFPDMTSRQATTLGERSGLMIFAATPTK